MVVVCFLFCFCFCFVLFVRALSVRRGWDCWSGGGAGSSLETHGAEDWGGWKEVGEDSYTGLREKISSVNQA